MKNIIIYISIITLISISIFIFLITKKDEVKENKLETLNHIDKKVPYFNKSYTNRYIKYHQQKKSLPLKSVIIHVNIGLDKDYYQSTTIAPNLYTNKVLVNKYHYLEKNYIPPNLVEVYEGYSRPGMHLVREAANHYRKMAEEMKKNNLTIRVISSYRSFDYQQKLYDKYSQIDGKKEADKYSARPGYSEHQTGLVIDIDNEALPYERFGETKEFLWLKENAHQFGFILRYPEHKEFITGYTSEAWHYRYVGKEIATYIKKHNITFDEYCAMNL